MNLSLKKIGDGKIKQILLFLYLAFQSVWNKICKLLNNGKFGKKTNIFHLNLSYFVHSHSGKYKTRQNFEFLAFLFFEHFEMFETVSR